VNSPPSHPIAAPADSSQRAVGWTAVLLAGQRPGVDPLASHFGESWKALVPVAGEAMLSRVARTLLATPMIARVVVVAQDPQALTARDDTGWLLREPRVAFWAGSGSIARSVAMVAGCDAAPFPILATTADHALLTRAMVERFLTDAEGADAAVGVVERRTILAAYPESKRTWLRFRGGAYSGANMFALTGPRALRALDVWASVEQDRKKGWRIVAAFGPLLLLGALTRTLSFAGALRRAGKRFGLVAKPVVLDVAEAAIDVDKPADHALAERILAQRG
jgi:GTP:adenosylcobinamide-phosphate guanylyltransferase